MTSIEFCPYCKATNNIDIDDPCEDDETLEYECRSCDQKFHVTVSYGVSFSVSKMPCDEKGQKHDFDTENIFNYDRLYCQCKNCEVSKLFTKDQLANLKKQ